MCRFRYGVFEEHGYPGDPVYPLYYLETQLSDQGGYEDVPKPNFCTDRDIEGHAE